MRTRPQVRRQPTLVQSRLSLFLGLPHFSYVRQPPLKMYLRLAVAAENIDQLVHNHCLDVGAGGLEVLTRIEMIGMLRKILADGAGHCQTQVGVDVYLADRHGSSLAELILGNADRTGHIAAVFVDHANKLLRNGGRTVQHYRETGQTSLYILEYIKTQLRLGAGLELICAMAGADRNGE